MNTRIFMKVYDEEKNLVGKREVWTNQLVSLSSMNPRGFIQLEVIHER